MSVLHQPFSTSLDLYNVNIQNLDVLFRFLLVGTRVLYLVNHIQSLRGAAEYCVLVVKPRL